MPTDSCCRGLLTLTIMFFCFTGFASARATIHQPLNDSTAIDLDTSALHLNWLNPDIRSDMVNYAKEFIGLHYKYAGRSPETGFDCSGFTQFVMRNFDVNISSCSRAQVDDGKKIDLKSVKSGDLIFFRHSRRSRISHVAMVYSNDDKGLFVIHSTNRGVVIDNLMESRYWRPKIYTARDILYKFANDYARRQIQLFIEDSRRLKEMNLDLSLISRSIRI